MKPAQTKRFSDRRTVITLAALYPYDILDDQPAEASLPEPDPFAYEAR